MVLNENDCVMLMDEYVELGLHRGDIGTVVRANQRAHLYEVEFENSRVASLPEEVLRPADDYDSSA